MNEPLEPEPPASSLSNDGWAALLAELDELIDERLTILLAAAS